jgi:hypothetical protein
MLQYFWWQKSVFLVVVTAFLNPPGLERDHQTESDAVKLTNELVQTST